MKEVSSELKHYIVDEKPSAVYHNGRKQQNHEPDFMISKYTFELMFSALLVSLVSRDFQYPNNFECWNWALSFLLQYQYATYQPVGFAHQCSILTDDVHKLEKWERMKTLTYTWALHSMLAAFICQHNYLFVSIWTDTGSGMMGSRMLALQESGEPFSWRRSKTWLILDPPCLKPLLRSRQST